VEPTRTTRSRSPSPAAATVAGPPGAGAIPPGLGHRRSRSWREQAIRITLFVCAALSVVTTAGIVVVLARESAGFFRQVPLLDFLFGTRWTPLLEPRGYGVLPLVCGTLLIVAGSSLIAIPVGVASAIFLSEYASDRARSILKPILEILAGVPTVVYGYFALTSITPFLMRVFPSTQIFNAASASIVVGIMILPMVASLCDDALRAVPRSLREAGYALGATHLEVSTQVVVPGALSGIMASFVLAVSRAIGETMAVTLAAGATPKLTLNPLESIQTMTAYIVQVSLGDTPAGTVEYRTIFAVGALLFVITLAMNLLASRILKRFREVYE
jgi:phosphate transport system permease protein